MNTQKNRKNIMPIIMTIIVWIVIQFDAVTMIIPNQIVAMAVTPIVWGIGAVCILIKTKKINTNDTLYNNSRLTSRDGLTLFFVIAGGVAIALSNFLYANMPPLFIRELFTLYPLYNIRNIIYYPLEVLLMLELLIYSQKAGDILTKKTSFPWGAVCLFILWGLPHILYHDFSDGIVSAFSAFISSIPFYASNKNIKTSYIGMLILWFLV